MSVVHHVCQWEYDEGGQRCNDHIVRFHSKSAAVAEFQLVWLHRVISLDETPPPGVGLALGGQFL